MSSKQNDHTAINLENYESYFMLYVDQELSKEEMEVVEAFLIIHPNLQQEFDLLMSTRLPVESFSFNKEELMSEHMQINAVDEDLLLYLDNELSADRKKIIELELDANKDYWMQYQLLAKAKLDAAETISYPNKEELYHRKGRVIAIQVWMRVAVALVVIAFLGILYFTRTSDVKNGDAPIAIAQPKENQENKVKIADPIQNVQPDNQTAETTNKDFDASSQPGQIAKQDPGNKQNNRIQKNNSNAADQHAKIKDEPIVVEPSDDLMAYDDHPVKRTTTAIIDVNHIDAQSASVDGDRPSEGLNKSPVTSFLSNRNTDVAITNPESDNHKGSFKGFLRKASRMIEKRTGFDPVNDNGELLIGMVAVKLK